MSRFDLGDHVHTIRKNAKNALRTRRHVCRRSRLRAPQDGPRAPFQERARGMLMKLPCVCVYRLRRITNETTWEKPVVKQPPPGVHA